MRASLQEMLVAFDRRRLFLRAANVRRRRQPRLPAEGRDEGAGAVVTDVTRDAPHGLAGREGGEGRLEP